MSQDITRLAGQCSGDKPTKLHNDIIIKTKSNHDQSAYQLLYWMKDWQIIFLPFVVILILHSKLSKF